jgi:hypothetical protein
MSDNVTLPNILQPAVFSKAYALIGVKFRENQETLRFETPAERFNACVASTG